MPGMAAMPMEMGESPGGIDKKPVSYTHLDVYKRQVLSQRPYIRIAGDDYPREVVKSRFLKVNFSHVEYVFDLSLIHI